MHEDAEWLSAGTLYKGKTSMYDVIQKTYREWYNDEQEQKRQRKEAKTIKEYRAKEKAVIRRKKVKRKQGRK